MIAALKSYRDELMRRKIWFIPAIAVSACLFIISCQYLYSGINKRFILFTLLSLGTGTFMVCPRTKNMFAAILALLFYLVIVPQKMFQRIELPVHDMSSLLGGAEFANILIIFLVYVVFLLIFQRVRLALGIGNISLLILLLINYYVNQFRGTSLSAVDLTAAKTALTVLDSYHLTMNGELWYTILWFCFFVAWGFWCDIPIKGKTYHLAVTAFSLSYFLVFYMFWNKSDYLEQHELGNVYWNVSANEPINGFLLSFVFSAQDVSMEKPEGYSEKALIQLSEEVENTYQLLADGDKRPPDIICIMNESWSDLRVLGNLETSEAFMPFYDCLNKNAVKGMTYVDIWGGLTANTEFEMLTGDSLVFLAPTAVPYQLQVNHDVYSMARVLREQGYYTMAMHPSVGISWNRNVVYDYFGFEEFRDINQFETELDRVGAYLSDECNFNEIILQYENRDREKPFFLFDVTIQNHGGYAGNTDILLNVETVGNRPVEEVGDLYDVDTYLNLMKLTDEALQELLTYFEQKDDPVIICMFGDHQPILCDEFYNAIFEERGQSEECQALKYITPYVIWANYDVDFSEYGDMSANYLGAAVLECAGTELPPYFKFLLQLQKRYPVISRHTFGEIKGDEMIRQYQMLQYNHLMEKNFQRELFSVIR